MQNLGLGGLNDSSVTGKLVSSRTRTHTLTPSLGSATSGMWDSPWELREHKHVLVTPVHGLWPHAKPFFHAPDKAPIAKCQPHLSS